MVSLLFFECVSLGITRLPRVAQKRMSFIEERNGEDHSDRAPATWRHLAPITRQNGNSACGIPFQARHKLDRWTRQSFQFHWNGRMHIHHGCTLLCFGDIPRFMLLPGVSSFTGLPRLVSNCPFGCSRGSEVTVRTSDWNVRVCSERVSQHIRDCQLPAAYIVGVAGSSPDESRSSASIPLLNYSQQHKTAKMRLYTSIFTLALSLGLAQADSGCTVTMTPSISDAQDPPDTITYGEPLLP